MSVNIISPFHKEWITSTLAPESIINIEHTIGSMKHNWYLDKITNHDKSISVAVLSSDTHIQAIGLDYDKLCDSPQYTFVEGLYKVAELLGITSITIK